MARKLTSKTTLLTGFILSPDIRQALVEESVRCKCTMKSIVEAALKNYFNPIDSRKILKDIKKSNMYHDTTLTKTDVLTTLGHIKWYREV